MSHVKTPDWMISASGNVVVHVNGNAYRASPTHVNYNKIVDKLRSRKYGGLTKLFDVAKSVEHCSRKALKVVDGKVYYGNKEVRSYVVDRILNFMEQGFSVKSWVSFLKRALNNKSPESVDQLYRFMEANNLPVTWDGYFIAYKYVTPNYKDFHTKTFDNTPGKTVEMPREEVEDNPAVDCGRGLHVGGYNYSGVYSNREGYKVVLVKVDPADVVSVPNDHNNGKCRVCKYKVLSLFEDVKPVEQSDVVLTDWADSGYDSYDNDEDDDDANCCPDCGCEWDDCECDGNTNYSVDMY